MAAVRREGVPVLSGRMNCEAFCVRGRFNVKLILTGRPNSFKVPLSNPSYIIYFFLLPDLTSPMALNSFS